LNRRKALNRCPLLTQSRHGRPAPLSVDLKKKKRPGAVTLTRRFLAMEHRQQSRRGLGITDGFAFVPPSVAVSVRHPLGIGTERSPHHQSRETFSRPAKSYLTNSAKCDRQRDSAATFRILHKRLRKRDAFCAGRSQREEHKISVRFRRAPICLACSLVPLSRGRA
jgi:hypothetical protein